MFFTEPEDIQIRALWAEGTSTAEIGRKLHRTKNSIISRAHRLDLSRPDPIVRDGSRTPRKRQVTVRQRQGHLVTRNADDAGRGAIVGPTLSPSQLASLGRRPALAMQTETMPQEPLPALSTCQWPLWENKARVPKNPDARFCGKPVAWRRNADGTVRWYP